MKQIPVKELIPGMVTAEDILTYDNKMIVPKGVVLTENIISRLEGYSIYYVQITDNIIDELGSPMIQTGTAPLSGVQMSMDSAIPHISSVSAPKSNKEKIKDSEQFKQFSESYARVEEHYKEMLSNSLYNNRAFRSNELLKETIDLLKPNGHEISVFDMLLNMHNSEDSVFAHCIDVALLSNVIARWLHFSENDQMMATACGLFHDVGKFMLPSGILRKPSKLTTDEFEIVKTHTIEGFHFLNRFNTIPQPVKNAALMHHEKCDGSGYPYGITGMEIDKFSKIVTIADIFDAMTSERVYRSAMCPFSVIKFFEDDGIQKYDMKYMLTFLENVANSYLNHTVTLSNGMEGNVIFINQGSYSRPVIKTNNNEIINLQEQYYNNIMALSNLKNVSIESII